VPFFERGIQPGVLREDGTMDFQERDLLKPVGANELVARLEPPVPGVPGTRVDGTSLAPEPPREAGVTLGPGVRLESNGDVVAVKPGVVLFTGGNALDVVDHHTHEGDVDLRSGNLEMEGSLVINGNITRGFAVRASGDVDVRGSLDGGSVEAGGNVTVRGGPSEGTAASSQADGDLAVTRAERVTLTSGGLLRIEEAVGSKLVAERIQILRVLRGGAATAELGIVAVEVGTPHLGTETDLVAAEPLLRPLASARHALDAAKTRRTAVRRAGSSRGGASRNKGGKLGRADAARTRTELELKAERVQRRRELEEIAAIQVTDVLHAGSRLQIGAGTMLVEAPLRAVRFCLDPETREIKMESSHR